MTEAERTLLHRYLDGAITAEELEALEELLRNDAEARATLRSLATIDAKWRQLAADEAVPGGTRAPSRPVGESPPENEQGREERANSVTWSPWIAWTALAVALVVGAVGWFRGPRGAGPVPDRGIARVIRAEGDGRTEGGRDLGDGTELFTGEELAMERGLVELAFRDTGVHVIATAPLRMKLDSDERVSLHEGQVKLVVPPQGVGFVVDTAQRQFVDLGTSFVVTANANGSQVLVLDGEIAIGTRSGESDGLMQEGEFAKFDRDGTIEKRKPTRVSRALPELSLQATNPGDGSLRGVVFGFDESAEIDKDAPHEDVIGGALLPLIRSEFEDRKALKALKQGAPIGFRGIAGAFHSFPDRTGLVPFAREGGWMAWYNGRVSPPRPGRYRFWGYADNHLLVAINGESVFEGSRRDSPFTDLGVPRTNNPALPCLIARAGFACGEWIELTGEAVQLDILFGEIGGDVTSGLLLVEREGEHYEETFWGQPKWPLFLTAVPGLVKRSSSNAWSTTWNGGRWGLSRSRRMPSGVWTIANSEVKNSSIHSK